MAETDLALQLKVWKELAISKQVLMRAATDALKLDPNCTQEELKAALETAIGRAAEADTKVVKAQEQANTTIAGIERQLSDLKRSLKTAEAARADAVASQERAQQQLADARANCQAETKKLKDLVAEKERALKAVNTALSDTPENVVKKLKALKKQKMDEAEARKRAEEGEAALRKEKKTLEQNIKDMQAAQEKSVQLATNYRELHTLCQKLYDQLKPLVEDKKSLPQVPMLDDAFLETIEKAGAAEEKKTAAKGKR